MKQNHDTDMIWSNFINDPRWAMCSSKRYHQAMRRLFTR